MASFWSLLPSIFMLFMAYYGHYWFPLASASQQDIPFSTISAAPAVLPGAPLLDSSPALSPDITPLFPSPGKDPLSPAESSLPTIPSSPSPPNPDAVIAPGPGISFPSGSLPAAASPASTSSRVPLNFALFFSLLVFCVMRLSVM